MDKVLKLEECRDTAMLVIVNASRIRFTCNLTEERLISEIEMLENVDEVKEALLDIFGAIKYNSDIVEYIMHTFVSFLIDYENDIHNFELEKIFNDSIIEIKDALLSKHNELKDTMSNSMKYIENNFNNFNIFEIFNETFDSIESISKSNQEYFNKL